MAKARQARNQTVEPAVLADPAKILAVQCVTGASPDCLMGPKTRERIAAYRADKAGWQPGDQIDDALQSEMNKLDIPEGACAAKPVTCPQPE